MNENALLRKIGDAPLSYVEQILLNEIIRMQQEGVRMKDRIRRLEMPSIASELDYHPNIASL